LRQDNCFFLNFHARNKFSSHPFTISQAPNQGEIQVVIKALVGSHKGFINTVKFSDEFAVSGPFGTFEYKTGGEK